MQTLRSLHPKGNTVHVGTVITDIVALLTWAALAHVDGTDGIVHAPALAVVAKFLLPRSTSSSRSSLLRRLF